MLTFKEFLVESQGANKHLEHIEDEVLNGGFDGVRKSIVYLSSLGSTSVSYTHLRAHET